MALTDKEIVESILQGNTQDFEKIVEKYYERLKRYSLRILNNNNEDAEDAISNSFMKIYQNLASYNPKLQFSSWAYRIVHNESVNIIRKNSNFFSFDPLSSSLQFFPGKDDVNISKIDVEKTLNKLNHSDKNILTLFYLEELSIKEISEVLKTSTGSVKSRLSIARKKAKNLINN